MKHTPGPWHVVTDDGSVGSVRAANGINVAQAQQTHPRNEDLRMIERKANAALIAAAPELLELAEMALEWIDAVPSCTLLPVMPGFDRDWADEVITKAKGE